MPETENIEQIDGHGTPKVDAMIPDSRLVSYGPLLGIAAGATALLSIKTPVNAMYVIGSSTAVTTAISLPVNWIISESCGCIIYHLVDTAVARGGAPKVDAVVPAWKGASLLGAFLGSSVGLVTGLLPSTRITFQDIEKLIDDELKQNKQNYVLKELKRCRPELKSSKGFPPFFGSLYGGLMGGVFLGSYCGLHNVLAKRRGVEDAYNHLAANYVASAAFGFLLPGSTRNKMIATMAAFVGSGAIAMFHSKVDLPSIRSKERLD